jgi:tRNA-specific 2-thiouridylase
MQIVYVGLSGGVDSAVSAALLKEQGYNVVGAFIKIWRPEFTECTWKEDRIDAMRVAATLQIPFREIDLSDEYKKEVVDAMVRDYAAGITPNPDVLCNKVIKFGSFYEWARSEGADFVATGHYARIIDKKLFRGKDTKKDQSYFLHQIDAKDLPHILFPVGDYEKSQIRALAKKFDLPNAARPDSQGLCFVGDISLPEFLSRYMKLKEGEVLDQEGKTIGKHGGAALYTIGQRHGFTVSDNVPMYVVSIDAPANSIRVSPNKSDTAVTDIKVEKLSWIRKPISEDLLVQTRYREAPVASTLSVNTVHFKEPHIVARGQSSVFYLDDECLGGGKII